MNATHQNSVAIDGQQLLASLKAFCFPEGEAAARLMHGVRTSERGEMRMSPKGRWIPFTAESYTDTTRSCFRWDARLDPGKLTSISVTDAYDAGHGRLIAKAGGVVTVMKLEGPDCDTGELQRYLSSIAFCPAILLNHASLECIEVSPATLRVRDRNDLTGATVDLGISVVGEPLSCRADRPRVVGKTSIVTPWVGSCREFLEWEGLRVSTHLEVGWELPEGLFTYYRSDITSFTAVS